MGTTDEEREQYRQADAARLQERIAEALEGIWELLEWFRQRELNK